MIRVYKGSFLMGLKVPLKGGSPCKPKTKMSHDNRQAKPLHTYVKGDTTKPL